MILNDVMALTMRYFIEFGKPASSSIELVYQKSASITPKAVKFVCVTKFTHSWVEWISVLLTCSLSFKFRFTAVLFDWCDACLPVYSKHCDRSRLWRNLCGSLLHFAVRVRCRRKKVYVRYLIFWWATCSITLGLELVICGLVEHCAEYRRFVHRVWCSRETGTCMYYAVMAWYGYDINTTSNLRQTQT